MPTRDHYGNHHLKGEQSASQPSKYSENDCQSSEQFNRDYDRRAHEWQWKPELVHDVRGPADTEDEELLRAMHEEYESHHNPEW